jgi:hypothetical protein
MPMIVTFSEEADIGRTLEKLTWARKILIVDSGVPTLTASPCSAHRKASRWDATALSAHSANRELLNK